VLDQYPDLVTVTESADSKWLDETAANIVIDNFTTNPDLNAVFVHGGSGSGIIEGLKSIDRLLPVGDPDHVTVCTNDEGTAIVNWTREGFIDAFGSHQSWDLIDGVVKQAFMSTVVGNPVKWDATVPMVAVTHDNVDSLSLFGVAPGWPWMPQGNWDLWPVMDLSGLGIETPTKAMRQEVQGY
jgi:ABC-type sugar transport system substrate-binding protein